MMILFLFLSVLQCYCHPLFTFLTHPIEFLGFLHVKFDLDQYIMKGMTQSCLPHGLVHDITHNIQNFLLALDVG